MLLDKHIQHIQSRRPRIDVLGQFIWFATPKAASTSIDYVLKDRIVRVLQKENEQCRSWAAVWKQITLPNIQDCFLWTFVRNPWDRLVSAFTDMNEIGGRKRRAFKWNCPHWPITFSDWIELELRTNGKSVDEHFSSQCRLFAVDGVLLPGLFVGRFETLDQDWPHVAERIGAPSTLPRRRSSNHRPYQEYYTTHTRGIVEKVFEEDIRLLGYTFEGLA